MDDRAVFSLAFALSDASIRFLKRVSTQRAAGLGMLDADVFSDLTTASDAMYAARRKRMGRDD